MKLEGTFLALTAAAVCLPYFFFFSHLAVPYSSASTCRYKLRSQQHFYMEL